MQITSASFIKGIVGSDPILHDSLFQIAFVGRSNVGKSSLINLLTNTKKLAISSSTPGRTLQINFFLIDEKKFFVDLPGYGYSIISAKQAEKMRRMILWYLGSDETKPKKVVLIIDAKVGPTKFDLEMLGFLREHQHTILVVANKIDKVKPSELFQKKRFIQENFPSESIFYCSTKTKQGRDELLSAIMH
jgi:GTP-binding protein